MEMEQVRYYEQVVAVMRRDHETLIQQHREEIAKQGEQVCLSFTTGLTGYLTRSLLCCASVVAQRRLPLGRLIQVAGALLCPAAHIFFYFFCRSPGALLFCTHTQHCEMQIQTE
jgi:hypothetical protein